MILCMVLTLKSGVHLKFCKKNSNFLSSKLVFSKRVIVALEEKYFVKNLSDPIKVKFSRFLARSKFYLLRIELFHPGAFWRSYTLKRMLDFLFPI